MMMKLDEVRSIPDIFRTKTPSLAKIKKEYGPQMPVDYLALWIIAINDMVNVGNKMTGFQTEYTAKLIFKENPLLTIADIKFVFDKAISGAYGELYNRLDTPIICTWFRRHWQERLETAEAKAIEDHQSRIDRGGERTGEAEKIKMKEAIKRYSQTKTKEK